MNGAILSKLVPSSPYPPVIPMPGPSVTGYFGGTTLVDGQYPPPADNMYIEAILPFSSKIASATAPPPCLVLSMIVICGGTLYPNPFSNIAKVRILPSIDETIGNRAAVFVPSPRTSTFGGIHSPHIKPGGTPLPKSS